MATARTNFENLNVYRLSEELSDLVWKITLKWSLFARDTVGKQIVRAADGVGANIAEGSGRGSNKENRQFVRMARGSLYETKHWLRRAYRRDLLTKDQVIEVKRIVENLVPLLNGYLKAIVKKC
jgi:four helix bundle protein